MKKTIAQFPVLLVAFFALFATSCSKDDDSPEVLPDPVAAFDSEVAADNPQLVSFTNNSENAEEFFWDFGDDSEGSTQKHPTHLYETAGTYTVTLTAVTGETETITTQDITVLGIPTADFTYEAAQDDSYTIHFTNESQNVDSYSWDFGDGENSTEENPSHTYAEAGDYTVTLTATGAGGTAETSKTVKVKDAQPAFENLYIVGDASGSGWNIGSPAAFEQSATNPFVFTYTGVLNTGNIKFSTFTGDDFCGGQWINAPEADLPATGTTGYIVTNDCEGPDNKWVITEETQGRYTITVDQENETVKFEKLVPAYSELYVLGDVTPGGWNLGTPEYKFTQSEVDPFVFTFEGHLSPAEMKISTFTGDFCDGDWIKATEANADIASASEFIITHGCDDPDNKWLVTSETEGDYIITVNLYDQSISFEKQ